MVALIAGPTSSYPMRYTCSSRKFSNPWRPLRPQAAPGQVPGRIPAPGAHGKQQQQCRLARRLGRPAIIAAGGNGAVVSTAVQVGRQEREEEQEGQWREAVVAAGPRGEVVPGHEFVWTRHWWPLLPESHLRPDRPNAATLLGMPLVIWRDGGGTWRVFRDRCPHRLAPLSEGRVEADGSLACSYHGWRFDGSGACRRIPQSLDAAAEAAACGSRRACATAFPCRIEAGMLWVWPDEGPDATVAAAAASTVMSYDLRSRAEEYDKFVRRGSGAADGGGSAAAAVAQPADSPPQPVVWFMRDMPYGYEVLLENLTDPSHLPFSHHGRAPALNRNTAGAMPMKPSKAAVAGGGAAAAVTSSSAAASSPAEGANGAPAATAAATATATASPPACWTRPSGPDFELDFLGALAPDATISVQMPYHVMYTYRLGKMEILTELFAVPVAPGRSRFFSVLPRRTNRPPVQLGLLLRNPQMLGPLLLAAYDPVVGSHKMLNDILDGDSVFLTAQDELILEAEAQAEAGAARGERGAGGDPNGAAAGATAATVTAEKGSPVVSPVASGAAASDSASSISGAGGGNGLAFWSRLYYLPVQSDRAVLAGRRWLEERAGGGPFRGRQRQLLGGRQERDGGVAYGSGRVDGGAGGPQGLGAALLGEAPSPAERSRRLDRYQQHTRHCPICSARLAQLQRLQAAARGLQAAALVGVCVAGGALGAAAALAASMVGGAAAAMKAAAALLLVLAAVWAAAGWAAGVVEQLCRIFLFQDYVHADKH